MLTKRIIACLDVRDGQVVTVDAGRDGIEIGMKRSRHEGMAFDTGLSRILPRFHGVSDPDEVATSASGHRPCGARTSRFRAI